MTFPWVDSDTFEPNKYFSRLLKEKTLSGLIKRDNELVAGNENGMYDKAARCLMDTLIVEIREIDGDMKTLVYENYSKFISATDTIRKVCIKIIGYICALLRIHA